MPKKLKKKISDDLDDGDSDLDLNNGYDSSESTLPTDPTLPGLAGLSLLDVCIVSFYSKKYHVFISDLKNRKV